MDRSGKGDTRIEENSPDSGGAIIKANTTENNGEISCSIEETNRIRLALGLKPLITTTKGKEQEAVDNFKLNAAAHEKIEEEKQIKEKIDKAKNKRLLHAKLEGETLADVIKTEDTSLISAAEWVRRSRKKELTEKEKSKLAAELAAKRQEEEEEENLKNLTMNYTSSDLKGLQIVHDSKMFETGENMILTLSDTSVLEKDEHGKVLGISKTPDILENVNLADEERRIDREMIKKRAKQPVYAGYDDSEFAEGMTPGTRPNILPQYDKEKKTGPKLVLGENGMTESGERAVYVDETDANHDHDHPTLQSLRVEKKELTDYYTKSEFSAFSKPKKEKKRRKIRKKVEIEDVEGEEGVADREKGRGVETLQPEEEDREEDREGSTGRDRGSRSTAPPSSTIADEEAVRRQKYDKAVQMAEEKVQRVFSTSSLSSTHNPVGALAREGTGSGTGTGMAVKSVSSSVSEGRGQEVEEDDDADIAQALARARRLALQKQRAEEKERDVTAAESKIPDDDTGAAHVRMLLQKTSKGNVSGAPGRKETHEKSSGDPLGDLDADGRREDGTLVFTSTTEFTARLQARLNERARTRAEAIVKEQELHGEDEEDGRSTRKRHDGEDKKSSWKDLMDGSESVKTRDDSLMDVDEEDEEEEEDEQMGFLHRQPLVAKGVAATLAMLKGSGDLVKKDELAGRPNDYRGHDPSGKEHGVKLEYRDEFGRKLTQKEAFRQLSYRFHGHGPGQKRQEKRLKALEMANKSATSRAALDSGTMLSLTRAQEATGKAHITIQGGVNPSDLMAVTKKRAKAEKERQHQQKAKGK